MDNNRGNFLRGLAVAGGGFLAGRKAIAQHHQPNEPVPAEAAQSEPRDLKVREEPFLPVHTPDLPKLPYELDNGVKVFHLIAEPVKREFVPSSDWSPPRLVDAWGYNGTVPGPIIEVVEGDRVRVVVDNHLPEMTSVHWHGFEIPILYEHSVRNAGREDVFENHLKPEILEFHDMQLEFSDIRITFTPLMGSRCNPTILTLYLGWESFSVEETSWLKAKQKNGIARKRIIKVKMLFTFLTGLPSPGSFQTSRASASAHRSGASPPEVRGARAGTPQTRFPPRSASTPDRTAGTGQSGRRYPSHHT